MRLRVRGSEVRGAEWTVGIRMCQRIERVSTWIVRKRLGVRGSDEGRLAERAVRIRMRESVERVSSLELATALVHDTVGWVCRHASGKGHLNVFFDGRFGEMTGKHRRRAVAVLIARGKGITGGGAVKDSTR